MNSYLSIYQGFFFFIIIVIIFLMMKEGQMPPFESYSLTMRGLIIDSMSNGPFGSQMQLQPLILL